MVRWVLLAVCKEWEYRLLTADWNVCGEKQSEERVEFPYVGNVMLYIAIESSGTLKTQKSDTLRVYFFKQGIAFSTIRSIQAQIAYGLKDHEIRCHNRWRVERV